MSTPRYATLRDYLRVLRAQRRIIILSVFLFGGVALLVSLTQEKSYKAEATLQLHELSEDLTLLGTPAAADSLITIQTQVTAKEISSPEVVAAVAKKLPQIFKKSDRSAIKAQVEATTNLVVITATNEDPANAARLANAFADQYRIFKQRETRNRLGESVRTLTARLNRLRRRTPNSTRKPFEFSDDDLARQGLASDLTRIESLRRTAQPVEVTKFATPPKSPASPRVVLNVILGTLIGLALGLLTAFGRDALNRRVRGPGAIQQQLRLPLLTRIPSAAMGAAPRPVDGARQLTSDQFEAFRILRTNLDFLADRPLGSILVTSALPEEGKTTVAAGLAWASALAGRRTLLIDCDLRRSDVGPRLGLGRQAGLVEYLRGRASTADLFQRVQLDPSKNGASEDTDTLFVMTAGEIRGNASVALGSEQFRDFLGVAQRAFDLVLIDSAPLLPVADTLELVPIVDGVVLCVRQDQTTNEQATAALEVLKRFPERPVGLVVTDVPTGTDPDYGYGYGYGDWNEPSDATAGRTLPT